MAAVTLGGCSQVAPSDAQPPKATQPAANTAAKLAEDAALRARLDQVLEFTRKRHLNPRVHNAWQIVHGVLAFGRGLEINDDGRLVPALDWILTGGALTGWTMVPGEKGLEAVLEAGTKSGQGHEDQWLGYLSQCGVELDQPIVVGNRTFKVADLVTQAQWDVREGMEATWTLMALSTYLPLDAQWTAKDGSRWTLERIIALESAQDLNASACGGSHRLYGIAVALNRYLNEGGKLTGGWEAAHRKIYGGQPEQKGAIATAKEFQQPDGAFSTNYFERAAASPDAALQINTTGHTLELLTLVLTDDQLQEPWVTKAVVHLCNLLELTKDDALECGGLYHAAHALQLYRLRRFGPADRAEEESGQQPGDKAPAGLVEKSARPAAKQPASR